MGNHSRLEFEWAFGMDAEEEFEKYTEKILSGITPGPDPETQLSQALSTQVWEGIGELDQEEFLEHLQVHLRELAEKLNVAPEKAEESIELRKLRLARSIALRNPKALEGHQRA